jgi:ATP-binding cassette subfamily B protein
MKPDNPSKQKKDGPSAGKLIMPYFRENRAAIVFGLVCLMLADAGQLYIPRIIKQAVDDLTTLKADLPGLVRYASAIVTTALLIAVFRYAWRRCLIGTSRIIEERLRDRFFSHIQTLSPSYFGRVTTGDLMAHATNDITNVRMATGMGMVALMDAVFLGTSTILFMVWIDGRLTFYSLLPMPLIVITARMFGRIMHSRYRDVQASFSELTEGVRERFAGIRIVKAYTLENDSMARVSALSRNFAKKNIDLIRVTGSFFPLMITISNISLVLVIYFGGRGTILGEISAGDLVAFISYLGLLTWPMMALGWMTNMIQRGKASLERIGNILEQVPDIEDSGDDGRTFNGSEELRFENVSYAYGEGQPDILSGVSFALGKGGITGLVGPPGCGKTTLLSLVPRLFDVRSGSIRLGGTDIRRIGLTRLRDMVSFTPQEPFLLEGTVKDNILVGNTRATDAEVIEAARKASLYDDVMGFRDGFDTLVGEKGVILSGGQKQRVGLARAFLHNRDIMIFDDPVSQVDTRTGASIIRILAEIGRTKKVLISSHRLAALRDADEILVFEEGRIVERGNHDRLMAVNGYYARTSRLQDMEEDDHEI